MSLELNAEGIICGYASTFCNEDNDRDVIMPGAFADLDHEQVKLLWQHQYDQPIGKIIKFVEDSYGLYVEAQLLLSLQQAKEAFLLAQQGIINSFSIGYQVLDAEFDNDSGYRIIHKIKLLEISLVTFPANSQAQITAVKEQALEHYGRA